ncbi:MULTISPECIES: hypothetical protein [unclassified Apibacter]|uniref:hypothetical protein n=1 Tax=unclassified Apibacter TaxID=2630820 RepID=UPI00132A785C|nr:MULTISPECIES: hypothetical protein [unclassified Apibacter]MCX8677110.1 hypothetical protein [Apibacter sp. B3919]MXO24510.1 hypothetical protein [Apibacter sp. B3924]MXO25754.1 hypothetical protein [Apibacter sp. B3813]MXO27705.1 hypothetical protein [Apibacter sp. B3913]MXO29935.1 hypothetical protein [Apibacter sp. B3912]
MKISYIVFFLGIALSISSCNNSKKSEKDPNTNQSKDSTIVVQPTSLDTISLSPIKKVPKFENKEVDNFVQKTKLYFEQIAEATQAGNDSKILELQLKANDIDENYKKVLKKLDTEQQKNLRNWYMQLVDAASK